MAHKINSIPVLRIDREDIIAAGFDGDNVTDKQLEKIAGSLNNYYCNTFMSVLYDTCKLHKVKPLND